jgi:NADH-quinone oxidoreductase subunit N
LFYYLRIIKLVYFDAPVDETPLEASQDVRMMVSVNSLFILLVGLFPGGLLALCLAAMG